MRAPACECLPFRLLSSNLNRYRPHFTASYLTFHAWPLVIICPPTTTFSAPVSQRWACKSTKLPWRLAQRKGVCGIFLMLEARDHNVLLGNPFLMMVRTAPLVSGVCLPAN